MSAYLEVFGCRLGGDDHDHPVDVSCDWGFNCNQCGADTNSGPCLTHAPIDIPGLRLVDCEATSRHYLFVHDAEDYGAPCYRCLLATAEEKDRIARQCKHWPWRAWILTRRTVSIACSLGLVAGYTISLGDGHDGCVTVRWRGRRLSWLFIDRDTWRCLRRGHLRGVPIGLGFCGKCVPMSCCGSTGEWHKPGCEVGSE